MIDPIYHPEWTHRCCAARRADLAEHQVDHLLNDPEWCVRATAARRLGLTPAQREKALNDPHECVRRAVRVPARKAAS